MAAPCASFAAQMRPSCASMIERQIESPMPIPLDFVVKKASNSRCAFSSENPTPQSVTVTCTCCASFCSDTQLARPIRDRVHRFDPVDHQIHDDLLQLHFIGEDER